MERNEGIDRLIFPGRVSNTRFSAAENVDGINRPSRNGTRRVESVSTPRWNEVPFVRY